MKTIYPGLAFVSAAAIAYADPIPQAMIDAAIALRQFLNEMLNPDKDTQL
jgi:hypothetical protein